MKEMYFYANEIVAILPTKELDCRMITPRNIKAGLLDVVCR